MSYGTLADLIGILLGIVLSLPVASFLARWSTRDRALDVPYSMIEEPQETAVIVSKGVL